MRVGERTWTPIPKPDATRTRLDWISSERVVGATRPKVSMTILHWIDWVVVVVLGGSILKLLLSRSSQPKSSSPLPPLALPLFIGQLVMWGLFGFVFFDGIILAMFLATIGAILVPPIIQIARAPRLPGPTARRIDPP